MGTLRAVGERWTVTSLLRRFEDAPHFGSPLTRASQWLSVAAVAADPLGLARVGRVDPVVVEGAVRRWKKEDVSEHQIRGRVAVLRSAVGWAFAEDYLVRDLLVGAHGLVSGGLPRTHLPVRIVQEAIAFARLDRDMARKQHAQQRRKPSAIRRLYWADQTLLSVCLLAEVGPRRGELCAFRTDDLDCAGLWIERAAKRTPMGVVIGPTKTYRSGRVTLSASTSRLWREYLAAWYGPTALSGVESFWMFSYTPGAEKPFSPETLPCRFGELTQRTSAGRPIGLHRVRHTAATVLAAAGHTSGAQRRLRHSRLDTTLRHYVDTTDLTDDRDVAEDLQHLYGAMPAPVSMRPVI